MILVNESRTFFKVSFNTRMKKYATTCELREKRKRAKKPAAVFNMTTDFSLPSAEAVMQANPNAIAMQLNLELINYEDVLPDDDDNSINETAV